MDTIPTNPDIAVSTINMWLRDGEYDSLEDLCSAFDTDQNQLIADLLKAGYAYNDSLRQFRAI